MAGINISSLTKTNSTPATTRRRSTTSLSKLSEAYRNPSRHETDPSLEEIDPSLTKATLESEQKYETSETKKNVVASKEVFQKVTNKESVGNQLVTQKVTNKESIDNPLVTNKFTEKPNSNQLVTQLVTTIVTNKESIDNQLVTTVTFKELSGLQRLISSIIFNDIKFSDEKITGPLSLSYLAEMAQTTSKTVKTATQRLVTKGVIKRECGKRGKGGWAQFSISKTVYNEMLQSELVTKKESIGNQKGTNWWPNKEPNKEPGLSSSNSSNNINTITTKDDDWVRHIQTPLNLKNLGLGQGHIKQLKEKFSLTPEQIQHGLEAFAYDLEKGELERLKSRGVQNIIGYFFGAMKSGGYNPVSEGFITAEDLAEKEMIERLETRKKEGQERSEKLLDLLFAEWLETKSREELIKIQNPIHQYLDMFHKADLKNHFQKNEMEQFKRELQ